MVEGGLGSCKRGDPAGDDGHEGYTGAQVGTGVRFAFRSCGRA